MNCKGLIARLEAIERTAFGLDRDARGERWIDRERRLLRIYFGMGLVGSGIAGSVGLFVLLLVASGPGFNTWFGGGRKEERAISAWERVAATDARAVLTHTTAEPAFQPPIGRGVSGPMQHEADTGERSAPTPVKIIAVAPVPQKAAVPTPPARLASKSPNRAPAGATTARPAQVPVLEPSAPAPVDAPAPIEQAAVAAIMEPAARPEGIVNLGGPGRGPDAKDATWWRRIWWGTGGFPVSEIFK